MKSALLSASRRLHERFCSRPLPDRLSIYLHELEPHQRDAFGEMVRFLKSQGYRFVDPLRFADRSEQGPKLFLSFDDNFRSWYDALDLFAELDISATFFINTLPLVPSCNADDLAAYYDRIHHGGDRTPLQPEEVRELHARGHSIGCHGHSHQQLTKVAPTAWPEEIAASKAILEDIVDHPVEHFSYPFGMRRHFSAALRKYCSEIGFRTVSSARPGLQYVKSVDPLNIHRTNWRPDRNLQENLLSVCIDGRVFESITGRSPVG